MTIFITLLAIASGISFAVQGPVNTALGKRTDTLQASLISFFGGTIICLLIVLLAGSDTLGLSYIGQAQPWQLIGGLFGAVNVCVTVLATPVLGLALTLAAIMFGQLFMGTLIDQFGLFEVEAAVVSPLRTIGIILVAAGIFCIYFGNLQGGSGKPNDVIKNGTRSNRIMQSNAMPNSTPQTSTPQTNMQPGRSIALVIIAFAAGILGAMQSPINASLAGVIGNWEGSFISFLVGFLGILVVMLIRTKGHFPSLKGKGTEIWMYTGGAYGVVGIFLSLYTVLKLGSALQVAAGMAGQLLAAVVIDTFGLIRTEKMKITRPRLAGIALIVLGVILVTLSEL